MSSPRDLARLDDALVELRRLWEQPAVRRRFAELVGQPVELGLLRTIRAIAAAEGEPGVVAVAELLRVDRSTASRAVDGAVDGGYVTRSPDPDDRRRCVLRLSDQGHDLLRAAQEARLALLAEATADWPAADLTALAGLLDRFVTALVDDTTPTPTPIHAEPVS